METIYQSIEILSKEKGIDMQIVLDAVKDAMLIAARKHFRTEEDYVAEMIRGGDDLGSITGVGGGIAAKLRELVETGRCAYHEELLSEIPRSLLDLLELPGLGPKGVSLVFRKLGVRSAEDLEAAIADGRFRTLPGMKEKKEARIRQGLEARRASRRSTTS